VSKAGGFREGMSFFTGGAVERMTDISVKTFHQLCLYQYNLLIDLNQMPIITCERQSHTNFNPFAKLHLPNVFKSVIYYYSSNIFFQSMWNSKELTINPKSITTLQLASTFTRNEQQRARLLKQLEQLGLDLCEYQDLSLK
jgi:hypothetical protein